MSTHEFADFDAAYVLGALSPADRRAFEEHLAGCRSCAGSVRELAGIPGLLARVDPDVLEGPELPPVPQTLLPTLLAEVRRSQRRKRAWTVGGLVAAASLVAAVSVPALLDGSGGGGPAPDRNAAGAVPGRPMTQVGQSQLSASIRMERVAWGTRLSMTCRYAAEREYGYVGDQGPTYALVVMTRDGHSEQVATWRAVAGRAITVTGAVATDRAQIRSVEVRSTTGKTVLRLAT